MFETWTFPPTKEGILKQFFTTSWHKHHSKLCQRCNSALGPTDYRIDIQIHDPNVALMRKILHKKFSRRCSRCRFILSALQSVNSKYPSLPVSNLSTWKSRYLRQRFALSPHLAVHLYVFALYNNSEIIWKEIQLYKPLSTTSTTNPDPNTVQTLDVPVGTIPTLPHIVPIIDTVLLDCILARVQQCFTDHTTCRPRQTHLPSRVLDVKDIASIRLVETEGQIGSYIALSYCWGGAEFIKTTLATIQDRYISIPHESLPRCFRDAVLVSRKMGIRFLWIDALCIIQDDSDDWDVQSSRMCEVYRNSRLTIAASRCPNPHHSFLEQRQQHFQASSYDDLGREEAVYMRLASHSRITSLDESREPLFHRAWALQERVVSQRVLSFTGPEAIYRCEQGQACECQPFQSSTTPQLPELSTTDVAYKWQDIVGVYSKSRLTYEPDVLPALSGLARRHSRPELGTYLAGYWEYDLPQGLFWCTCIGVQGRPRCAYTAPSWSWASLVGDIDYTANSHDKMTTIFGVDYTYHHCLDDVSCTQSTSNVLGPVSGGYIKIRGFLVQVSHAYLKYHGQLGCNFDELCDDRTTYQNWPDQILLLGFGKTYKNGKKSFCDRALIVEKVHSDDSQVQYRRIGLLTVLGMDDKAEEIFGGVPLSAVTII